MKTKKCTKCGEEYPLTKEYWHVDRSRKDGFYFCCKDCRNKINREYVKERAERELESKKEYAIYKGEEVLMMGTMKEITDKLNIKVSTVLFYNKPAHKKRMGNNARVAVCLD